jgi:Tfp pilus assembly protein PilP
MIRRLLILLLLSGVAVAQEPSSLPPLSTFNDVAQRPLFSPSRRPQAVAATAKLSSASLTLTGIVTEQGKKIALIRMAEQRTEVRVGPGASLNGWQIATIDDRGIDLAHGPRHLHVLLKQGIPAAPE